MSTKTTGSPNNETIQPAGANKDEGPGSQASAGRSHEIQTGTDGVEQDFADAEMPGVMSKALLKELAGYRADYCISIFIGVDITGEEGQENIDPVSFKERLQGAEQQLINAGFADPDAHALLAPAYDLADRIGFWQLPMPGFAAFIAEDYFKFIRMPLAPVEEQIVLENSFYITPLIPVLERPEYFYVLVISKHGAKLFKGDAWDMHIVPLDFPDSLQEVKRLPEPETTIFPAGSNGSRHSQEVASHGSGHPGDKGNMQVFFQTVDDIIWKEVLHGENAPLVIAGVEYEIPIYKNVCKYNHVWAEPLTGSREHQETAALYADAKAVLQPYFEQRTTKALERYANNSANGNTASIIADVIPAAYYAQVSHLFVAAGAHLYGTFDEMANMLEIHDTKQEHSEDLIDNAVEKTLANGGEVFLLDQTLMPAESPVAAILRF